MTHDDTAPADAPTRGVSRRALLGGAGAGIAALGIGAAGGFAAGRSTAPEVQSAAAYPFQGTHQSGVVTPQQDHLHFAAFDVTTDSRDALITLLRQWSAAAVSLTAGQDIGMGTDGGSYDAPPDDTGEAHGLSASGLTLTFGFGRSLFEADGVDRFGLADRLPSALIEIPHFSGDDLEPGRVGGDLCVQACADDPQVATHAIRNLARIAFGTAALRWDQLGFGRTSSTTRAQTTPRNLMGFKDGTANLKAEDASLVDEHVWASADDGAAWMASGTYLVARRIRILTDTWDRTSLREQEQLVGRTKGTGAPLSGGDEFTEPDFEIAGRDGAPLIPVDSHVQMAHPAQSGVRMLRRGYNFTDGADSLGRLNAGLFFLAFVRDPATQFVPLQSKMSKSDLMTVEYLRSTGSALFAVPAAIPAGATVTESTGRFIGDALFS
ncbi:MAG: iron uptake transporter deferrochelatase/peroxidase subunit [Demequina sp.]|uniref:iron uptake transporter deferrochelatase/peroxidase subunit n=1 Tax=Demequina sp. TaxID=2050685 RepID=UPI003A8749F3